MKKALFIISMLLVAGLLIGGCTGASEVKNSDASSGSSETSPENYVDSQLIDDTADVEIGEMI